MDADQGFAFGIIWAVVFVAAAGGPDPTLLVALLAGAGLRLAMGEYREGMS